MTLIRNVLANYVGAGVVVLAPIIALPWYLNALGAKQYGLVSFVAFLQAILGLLDAGVGQALIHEFAVRYGASGSARRDAAVILYGFERIYWIFSFCVGCGLFLLAGVISEYWLRLDGISTSLGVSAVYGSAIIFMFQFPGFVYRSFLVGAQAQTSLGVVTTVVALLRHGGAVWILQVYPTLYAYIAWHAMCLLLETLGRAILAWKVLNIERKMIQWDIVILQTTWKHVFGLSGATLLGVLTTQVDKVLLSRMVPVEDFGKYMIASTLSLGILQLIAPLIQAVQPRAIQLRASPEKLKQLYIKLILIIGVIILFGGGIFLGLGEWILLVWLKNVHVVAYIYPIMIVLLLGTALNALYNVGYLDWIVHKNVRGIRNVNILSLILSILIIPVLVSLLGVVGAAFGWVVVNVIGLLLSLGWVRR